MIKDLDAFAKDRTRKAGVHPYCRPCAAEIQTEWRRRYPERHAALQRRAYEKRKARLKTSPDGR